MGYIYLLETNYLFKTNRMKNVLKLSGMVVAIFGMMMITNTAMAQPQPDCNTVVASDCIGACGPGSTIGYVAAANGFVTVASTSSSLCPNTGCTAQVTIAGKNKGSIDISQAGDGRRYRVKAGDLVQVTPSLYNINNGIVCVWLGEVVYAICE